MKDVVKGDVWEGLSKAEHSYMESYVRQVADKIGLKDWQITVEDVPCREEAAAHIDITPLYREAAISVSREWSRLTNKLKQQILVHETLHCVFDGMRQVLLLAVEGMDDKTKFQIRSNFNRVLELDLDTLAWALAKLLPPYRFKEVSK